MSGHDHMSRSGYAEDAYPDHVQKFPAVDAEGKSWSVTRYGRSLGTHTYFRKVESCVQEIRASRPAYTSSVTIGFPPKGSGPFNNDGRPWEVHDFLTKRLTEVNGLPRKTSDPKLDTSQGGHSFPHEPPARTTAPNLGFSFPGNVERVDVREVDHSYGTSPVKVNPTNGPLSMASDLHRGSGWYSFPVEEVVDNHGDDHRYGSSPARMDHPAIGYGYNYNYSSSPRKPEASPNHKWGWSSSPVYDRPSQGGHGVPNSQGGGYGLNSEAPRSSTPIYGQPSQRNYQLSDNQFGSPLKSRPRDYGVRSNPSPGKPSSPRDREVQNNGWGDSPVKSNTPYGYGVSPDNIYASNPEKPKDYTIPDSQWGNPETREYAVPNNKWVQSSNPMPDQPRDDPEKRWGGSIINPKGYEKPSNQWDKSSNPTYDPPGNNPSDPKNQLGSSPLKSQSQGNYDVPSNQQGKPSNTVYNHPRNNPSGSENRWGSYPVKTHSPRNYGVPSNQWDRSSSPVYNQPGNDPSGPKDQWGSSVKTQSPENYGVPSYQPSKPSAPVLNHTQNNSSGPKNQWGSSPLKTESSRGYGPSGNRWDRDRKSTPSGPRNQLESSPVKTQSPRDYGASINQQGRPSSPVYDHLQNHPSGPEDPLESSSMKTQSPRGHQLASNRWKRPSSAGYDRQPNDEQYKPPQVTCKDGVCTLNDKPKAPQGIHDEPKSNTNGFRVIKPSVETQGLRSNPYTHDDQPKDNGRSTNQMKPSGYNFRDDLEHSNFDAGTPPGDNAAVGGKSSVPPAAGLSGTQKFTVPPPVGSIRDSIVGSRDIDSREAAMRYGGRSFLGSPYASEESQSKTISSTEAIQKYNGSFVPKPK